MAGEGQTQPEQEVRYVASIRTALSGPEDGIVRALPEAYRDSNVGDVLGYLTERKQLKQDEVATAQSVQSEMSSEYSVTANGVSIKPEDNVSGLFQERTHRGVPYQALEMEVASVQEGGLEFALSAI